MLLYREDDSHGRRLLFDSHALQKVTLKDSSNSSGGGGKFLKNSAPQNGKIQAKAHSNNNGANLIEVCPEYGYKVNYSTAYSQYLLLIFLLLLSPTAQSSLGRGYHAYGRNGLRLAGHVLLWHRFQGALVATASAHLVLSGISDAHGKQRHCGQRSNRKRTFALFHALDEQPHATQFHMQ